MEIALIGEYECSLEGADERHLLIHHVPRGYDVVRLSGAAIDSLREELASIQKRIRALDGYQLIFGANGDLSIYGPQGQRACYFTTDQAQALYTMLTGRSE